MKIGAIVPYKELGELTKNVFEEHSNREYVSKYADYEFELEVIIKHDNYEELRIDCDVIIARGDAVYTLRELYDIPVVEIPIGAFTIEQAILEAVNRYKPTQVAAIGFYNILVEMEKLSSISGVNVKTYYLTTRAQLEDTMRKAVREGADVVLCGVNGCKVAEKIGCNAVLIKSNKQEVWHAITEAKRSAYVYNIQRIKTERFKNILNYSFEGILTVENDTNVLSFNKAAGKILIGESETNEAAANKINDVIHTTKFREVVYSNKMYTDEIIRYKNKCLTVNKIPIFIKNENKGSVILFQDSTRIQELESKIRKQIYTRGHVAKYTFKDILGRSRAIMEAIETAREYARVDSNVLILGETGTGKEIFAQSIHAGSSRKDMPFVAINCAALPENLLESELFGYVEGAFTGASRGGKPGFFELAHKGTIFLDEISEIPLKLQGRLLRVIQEREIVRIGDDKVTLIDVRIISASNKRLEQISLCGDFREDLYYRLDVLKIHIPSLNERREDIPLLAEKFINEYNSEFSKKTIQFEDGSLKLLQNINWKGNIRQLRNVCERLAVLNKTGIIDAKGINKIILEESLPGCGGTANWDTKDTMSKDSYRKELETKEKKLIEDVLEKYNGNKALAAAILGLSIATLYRRIKKLGIK